MLSSVAIARTSETLTFTFARSHWGWEKALSRILVDMRLLSVGRAVGATP